MLVDVKKVILVGVKEDLDLFFDRAQVQGFLEFISFKEKKPLDLPIPIQSLVSAIKILRKQPIIKKYEAGGDLPFAMQVTDHILQLKSDIERLGEEGRLLEAEIARIAPFGDFAMEDIEYIEKEGHRKVQFFCMKTSKRHKTGLSDQVLYVGTEYDLDYFISINPAPTIYPDMIEMRIDCPVSQLQNRLQFITDAIHRFEATLKTYAGHIEFLQSILADELNRFHLINAKRGVAYPLNETLFVSEAWIPENKIHALYGLIDGMAIHTELVAIEEKEKIPTHFDNHGLGLIGEDLVRIYDIPATTDRDPSYWVLAFFTLFFAIIVADGGYGLLYLAVAVYLRMKFPELKGQARRLLKLFTILSVACIVWGVLTASFFGIHIAPFNPVAKLSVIHYLAEKKAEYHLNNRDDVYQHWVHDYPQLATAKSGNEMLTVCTVQKGGGCSYKMVEEFSGTILLEFTLVVAIIHISLSFMRHLKKNIAGLGWITAMIGGYLFFPSFLHATAIVQFLGWVSKTKAPEIGIQLMYGGVGFALLSAIIQKRAKGLGEIATSIQIFADVLSYLRLYALGLAATIMASTFNGIGATVGLVAGAAAVIAGHAVNIMLGVAGGVIHGLRLNFLEWYRYCFDGGGRLFKPLQKLKFGK